MFEMVSIVNYTHELIGFWTNFVPFNLRGIGAKRFIFFFKWVKYL